MNKHNNEALLQFWAEKAIQYVDWQRPWQNILQGSLTSGDVLWFSGGKLNVSVNCLDRHLPGKANHIALLWEGDDEHQQRAISFAELYEEVCRMANVLKQLGINKGDKVAIYLPMIPEAAIAMLACTRIGAVHTVIFAGFSAQALQQRLIAAECELLITADGYQRGGKTFCLKEQADEATKSLVIDTLIIKHNHAALSFKAKHNYWWHELKLQVAPTCTPELMDAEDPLFILYTSGSTGEPKGVVHTTGGYLVQVAFSYDYVFNCTAQERFWCTADVGWITGHSYIVYGPLCNGITTFIYGGIPNWPDPARCWQIIDRYHINVFYTAPTAIRALKRAGDHWLASTSRSSLRLLGVVGEPINSEAWQWYKQKVGNNRCAIVDTWWQTETGAIMICPTNAQQNKPGAACQPLPGIKPVLLNTQGIAIDGAGTGLLAISYPWPAMARTIAGDHRRYCKTYLAHGYYITGDEAKRDAQGDYWIIGRLDDVLNVSGHRLGTAEIENALVTHPKVAEAAVVGIPHTLKGQGIYAFVCLKHGYTADEQLLPELFDTIKQIIGAIAKPDVIQCVSDLPKTRSGKIMRRILRQLVTTNVYSLNELGDLSMLANPHIVEELIELKLAVSS